MDVFFRSYIGPSTYSYVPYLLIDIISKIRKSIVMKSNLLIPSPSKQEGCYYGSTSVNNS